MSQLDRHCLWLLFCYPSAYRNERGGEILGTLLEVSRPAASWPPATEVRAVVSAGLRRRFGLAGDQPLGSLIAMIAGWYLLMGAVLAGGAMVLGEWVPWAAQPARQPYGFGPFVTDGVPVYVAVLLAAVAWALRWRKIARALVACALVLAAAMVTLEHLVEFWGRPPLSFVLPLLVCVGPALVYPAVGDRLVRPEDKALGAFATAIAGAASVWFVLATAYLAHKYRAEGFFGGGVGFYRLTLAVIARWLPLVGVVFLLATGFLAASRRVVLATGLIALSVPWLMLSVLVLGSPVTGESGSADAGLIVLAGFAAMALWLRRISVRRRAEVAH